MALPCSPALPFLLYSYPWMPFPRRIAIYLREKQIPSTHVRIVRVSDPKDGNRVVDFSFPPRPAGSLPVLAVPSEKTGEDGKPVEWFHIRQSMAIIHILEEICEKKLYGFDSPVGGLFGTSIVERVRINEVLTLAEECTVNWNPVRTFGTNAGTMSYPEGAKEMLRWVRRPLMAIETWWQESDRDMSLLRAGIHGHVTVADIVLYQFLEFTKDCYAVDMTDGSQEQVKDVYGRDVVERFPKLAEFFEVFRGRESAVRDEQSGELPGSGPLKAMQTWAEGVL